jgi:uncharacterized protein YndB with AHSA1/START domain
MRFSANTTINASPDTIWAILVDAERYPEWDPGIDHIEGTISAGESVKFFTVVDPSRAFAVKVTAFEPGSVMVLTGGMPMGLFKSERTHTLTPDGENGTKFHTEEVFSGVMLSLFKGKIPDLTENFEQFAAGLKTRAEGQANSA